MEHEKQGDDREQRLIESVMGIESESAVEKFLLAHCPDDDALKANVRAWWQQSREAGSFLERTAVLPADSRLASIRSATIGPYKLLQKIGEGGMGEVWMAEQQVPVRRRVALKIIKAGMDTWQVIARFEAERQALALMDHPSIARIFDGGATEQGRPYFVMELVNGVPITKFCDERRMSTRERLELFVPVCQAVQHAHQKGIIHRDLTPRNVLVCLVDDRPVPKIIDFGLAKATQVQLTDKTFFTEFGQIVGTISYMSPEQARLDQTDIDTRSDIYSLGVILYELLIGQTPFDQQRLRSVALDEVLRIIRDEEPPKPSIRLSSCQTAPSIAASRQLEPDRLSRLVRGELDCIVMCAIEKERHRRYPTALNFAQDVQRYLAGESVLARTPSLGYRMSKTWSRHRVAIMLVGLFAVLLLAAMGSLAYAFISERNQSEKFRRIGQNERNARLEADLLARFWEDLFRNVDPERIGQLSIAGKDMTVVEFLDDALPELLDSAEIKSEPKARILRSAGNAYYSLGKLEKAIPIHERSRELFRQALGDSSAWTRSTTAELCGYYKAAGKADKAIPILESMLVELEQDASVDNELLFGVKDSLGGCYMSANLPDRALLRFLEAYNGRRSLHGESDERTMLSLENCALALDQSGRHAEAGEKFDSALKFWRSHFPNDPRTTDLLNNLARCYWAQKRYADAVKVLEECIERCKDVFDPEHPKVLLYRANLGVNYWQSGDLGRGIDILNDVVEICRRLPPERTAGLTWVLAELAAACETGARWEEAEPVLDELVRETPEADPNYWNLVQRRGVARLKSGKFAEAIPDLKGALKVRKETSPDSWLPWNTQSCLGECLLRTGKLAEAEPLLLEAHAQLVEKKAGIPETHRVIRIEESFDRVIELFRQKGNDTVVSQWEAKKASELELPGQEK